MLFVFAVKQELSYFLDSKFIDKDERRMRNEIFVSSDCNFFLAYVLNVYDPLLSTPKQDLKKIEKELQRDLGPQHAML